MREAKEKWTFCSSSSGGGGSEGLRWGRCDQEEDDGWLFGLKCI